MCRAVSFPFRSSVGAVSSVQEFCSGAVSSVQEFCSGAVSSVQEFCWCGFFRSGVRLLVTVNSVVQYIPFRISVICGG